MKILIIRSAPIYVLDIVIDKIKENFKEADIFVLTSKGSFSEVSKYECVKKIIIYQETKFSIFKLGIKLWCQLLGNKFDKVVILYSNYFGESYLNVELISFFIFARNIIGFNMEGKCIVLGYKNVIMKNLECFFYFTKCFMVWILVLILMPFIYVYRETKKKFG